MRLSALALSLLIIIAATSNSWACAGIVRVSSVSIQGSKVIVGLRVFANYKEMNRTVFYSLSGDVRQGSPFGNETMKAGILQNANTTIESGEEYADDEVEIFVSVYGVFPPARITSTLVTNCYP